MARPATAQRFTLRIVGKVVVLRVLNLKKDKFALNEGPLPAKWNYIAKPFEASQKATKRHTPKGDAGSWLKDNLIHKDPSKIASPNQW